MSDGCLAWGLVLLSIYFYCTFPLGKQEGTATVGTDEREQVIKDLLYDIDRMERDCACYKAKLNQILSQWDAVKAAAQHGLIDQLDEKGTLWVRIAGVNERKPLAYPSVADLATTSQAITDLTKRIAEKKQDLAHCRGTY